MRASCRLTRRSGPGRRARRGLLDEPAALTAKMRSATPTTSRLCVTMTTVLPRLPRERVEQRQHRRRGLRVQRAGGLVGQDRARGRGPAPARWRPAAARRRTAGPAGSRPGRRGPTRSSSARARATPAASARPFSSSGRSRFSSTVRSGIRLKNWKTKPMRRRRKRVRASSSSAVRSVPSTTTRPEVGRSMPAIRLSSVDFPDPLRPTSTAISPGSIATETSLSTARSESPSR